MVINTESVISDLRGFGVSPGDTLFVRANCGAIGRVKGGRKAILDAFLQSVAPGGTLVTLAFTESFLFRSAPKDYVFSTKIKSNAGALPNLMLQYPGALRSSHPMTSVVAIGAEAESIISGHDENASAYKPIQRLVELNAKMLLIGIVNSSPGFTTTHLAEQDLKLYRRVAFPTFNSVYYQDKDGNIKLFRRKDPGLCSYAFDKFYPYYVSHELLLSGHVGQAYSISVEADPAYNLEKEILKKNPRFSVCDRPNCMTCNLLRLDRFYRMPFFVLRTLYKKLFCSGDKH